MTIHHEMGRNITRASSSRQLPLYYEKDPGDYIGCWSRKRAKRRSYSVADAMKETNSSAKWNQSDFDSKPASPVVNRNYCNVDNKNINISLGSHSRYYSLCNLSNIK